MAKHPSPQQQPPQGQPIPRPKRTSQARNRGNGKSWEHEVIRALRQSGYPGAVSTRSENRRRDDQLVDVCNEGEAEHGRMIDDIQCKFTTMLDWSVLLEMEKHDKGTPKRRKALVVNLGKMVGGKRYHKGKFVVMQLRDYLNMLAVVKKVETLDKRWREMTTMDILNWVDQLSPLTHKRDGHV